MAAACRAAAKVCDTGDISEEADVAQAKALSM